MRVPQWLGMSPWSPAEQSGPGLGFLGISFKWLTTIPIYIYIIYIYMYIHMHMYYIHLYYICLKNLGHGVHPPFHVAKEWEHAGESLGLERRLAVVGGFPQIRREVAIGGLGPSLTREKLLGSHVAQDVTRLRIFVVHEILRIFSEWIIMCTSFGISYHAEI